jgi:DNA-binding LacI/PurR family transcriptional regulator
MSDNERTGKGPSMADVAARAGVSAQTVSRTLRGHPYVTADKRDRVLAAAEALGYRMNAAAKALSSGRTRLVGVVMMATDGYAGAATHALAEQAARARGYGVTVTQTPSLDLPEVLTAVRRLEEGGAEALVLALPLRRSDPLLEAVAARLPTATIGGSPVMAARRFDVDQQEVARLVTDHLLGLGHRTVHHVSGPEDWIDAVQREQGWRDALARRDITPPAVLRGDWSAAAGHRIGLTLFEDPVVTAVLAANDDTAIGLVRALHDLGRHVPGDVSVAGVDDIPLAAYTSPRLTTVRQPFQALTRIAVSAVIARLEGSSEPSVDTDLTAELVVRGSTGPARS